MSKTFIQYCVPQHLLSRIMGKICDCRWVWLKNWMITRFIREYHVNMSEALSSDLNDYPSFNSFFTRQLNPDLRPMASPSDALISPADGKISQIGAIEGQSLFQAKGFHFTLTALLGGSDQHATLFQDGRFATLYLSPKDYHRVHMPLAGLLQETIYIPGKLFSVNTQTTQAVPNLFARNERLVCLFETEIGPMAVILVGAMLVGSIRTAWDLPITPGKLSTVTYPEQGKRAINLRRGAELGHFRMGSTVILLFGKDRMNWSNSVHSDTAVKMGQLLGTFERAEPSRH